MTPFGESIPGETPLDDISGLKVNGITTRAELNRWEAVNIEKVVAKYLAARPSRRSASFAYDWCLQLHHEMFGDVWDWAGQIRNRDLNLGLPYQAIPENLAILWDDLQSWPGFGIAWDEQAARLHHRAVQIHPFLNGNGRWARMLANIWLKLHRQPLTLWPEAAVGTSSVARAEYLAAIVKADEGDYEALLTLQRRFAHAD